MAAGTSPGQRREETRLDREDGQGLGPTQLRWVAQINGHHCEIVDTDNLLSREVDPTK